MNDPKKKQPLPNAESVVAESTTTQNIAGTPTTIVLQQINRLSGIRKWFTRLLMLGLLASVLMNFGLYSSYKEYFSEVTPPVEKFHSGDSNATEKIAVLKMTATISPPFTEQWLRAIQRAKDDDNVKGVVLQIDSPGGFVADSHQLYHRLQELSRKKPMIVSMRRMAASGGYYIAMGAGSKATIYAEPTTWTGSIGVIIPRYNAAGLAKHLGIRSEPLKTGPFKDALSPFHDLSTDEYGVWQEILSDSFEKFLSVIAENRQQLYRKDKRIYALNAAASLLLDEQLAVAKKTAVEDIATGQIITANQAVEFGLVDKIGFLDDAIDDLKAQLNLDSVRVVTYKNPPTVLGMLTGTMQANQPAHRWQTILNATTPRAMYYHGTPIIIPPQTP